MHLRPRDSRDEDLFIQLASTPQTPPDAGNSLDDVFGSDSDESPAFASPDLLSNRESHPSDTTRLQQEHATAGYRDGITAAKAQSIQAGFDEGFSLAATIGLKAGQLLGYLEGIAGALRGAGGENFRHANSLLENARKELNLDMMFNEQYWASDGTWKYEVGSSDEENDILFDDVANAHPMISKWIQVVNQEVSRWHISRDILELTDGEAARESVLEKKEIKAGQQPREMLDW